MSGHSKWTQIKRKKAVTDARRGQRFTKLIREITVAARSGGGDPNFNPRLRLAVDTAKVGNMPQENIDRAIKKGTGELEGVHYEEIDYEGYGPAGVAIYVECLTDNANRTVQELRHMLERHGGNLGTAGSVAWQFDRRGQLVLDAGRFDEDAVLEAALEAGAEDVKRQGTAFVVTTEVADFHVVQQALGGRGFEPEQAELAWIPRIEVPVAGKDAERLLKLLDLIEDHDDVQKVHTNADINERVLAAAEAV